MRVDNKGRISGTGGRGNVSRPGTGPAFNVDLGPQADRAGHAAGVAPASAVGGLLALQEADSSTDRKRRAVRRGRSLLDLLDALRADLLAGGVSDGRLDQLMSIVAGARDQAEPGLDALLDDIELRARVELAKRGRFPR